MLALNKADLVEPEALEAAVRQARQLDSGETVVISAIKPATLDALLEKAGAILARNLGATSVESVEHKCADFTEDRKRRRVPADL